MDNRRNQQEKNQSRRYSQNYYDSDRSGMTSDRYQTYGSDNNFSDQDYQNDTSTGDFSARDFSGVGAGYGSNYERPSRSSNRSNQNYGRSSSGASAGRNRSYSSDLDRSDYGSRNYSSSYGSGGTSNMSSSGYGSSFDQDRFTSGTSSRDLGTSRQSYDFGADSSYLDQNRGSGYGAGSGYGYGSGMNNYSSSSAFGSGRYNDNPYYENKEWNDDRFGRYANQTRLEGRWESPRHEGGRHEGGRHEGGRHDSGRHESGMMESMKDAVKSFFGKGPKGYKRSDERIKEDVSEVLYRHPRIDASEIEVDVKDGNVTLMGTVEERSIKRLVEDVVEDCSGVSNVTNQLRVVQKWNDISSTSSSSGLNASSSGSTQTPASTSGKGSKSSIQ